MAEGDSWGRLLHYQQRLLPITNRFDPHLPGVSPMIAYGNGRSYGDVCLNEGGTLLLTRGLDRFIAFDPLTGILDCEAGVLLRDIIGLFLPRGWFVPVVPGTALVTVGGAIANDVHGKNHHRVGSFGNHVLELELQRSDSRTILCSPVSNSEWYQATIGGMGLTGLIRRARLQLRRVEGPWIRGKSRRFARIAEFFELARETEAEYEYTVAWIDCCASGAALGRGVYMWGNHAADVASAAQRRRLRVPFTPPLSLVNGLSMRLFNQLYFHRPAAAMDAARWHYEPFFFPLDSIEDWNRIYGPKGFFQYQCAIPHAVAEDALPEILGRISRSGSGSFLAVLKRFGEVASRGLMSFPRPGVTLALDFPNQGARTLALLESLDEITRAAGGAVYPAKDARMSAASFQQYYPAWQEFERFIDPHFSSSFWRRVAGKAA
jgi:FAD/FMN-containing dehydrogenase